MKKIKVTAGEILKEEFLDPLNISQYRLANEIKVSKTLINKIIKGKTSITPDIALRLSMFFGTTAEFWLNIQNFCDLEKAEEDLKAEKIKIQSFSNICYA